MSLLQEVHILFPEIYPFMLNFSEALTNFSYQLFLFLTSYFLPTIRQLVRETNIPQRSITAKNSTYVVQECTHLFEQELLHASDMESNEMRVRKIKVLLSNEVKMHT